MRKEPERGGDITVNVLRILQAIREADETAILRLASDTEMSSYGSIAGKIAEVNERDGFVYLILQTAAVDNIHHFADLSDIKAITVASHLSKIDA